MGILNVTPDSFSDGGRFSARGAESFRVDLTAALDAARALVQDGAQIIDVGGESTRPGSEPIDEAEEIRRVVPVVRALAQDLGVPISVDSYRPATLDAALDAGAEIVNDVAAGRYDSSQNRFATVDEVFPEEVAEIVARCRAGAVLMHMRGEPRTMQATEPVYANGVTEEVFEFLAKRRDRFLERGVELECLAFDPGVGFGKTVEQNWTLIRRAEDFQTLGGLVLFGCSRKRFLTATVEELASGSVGDLPTRARELPARDAMTAQVSVALARRRVDVLRVHNVGASRVALELARRAGELTYKDDWK